MDYQSELLTKIPGNSTPSVIMSCVCRAGPAWPRHGPDAIALAAPAWIW